MSIPYIFLTLFHIIRFPRTPCTNVMSIPKTISYIVNTPRGVSKASRLMLFMPRTLGRHTFYPWCRRRSYLVLTIDSESGHSWIGTRAFVFYPSPVAFAFDYATQLLPSTIPSPTSQHPSSEMLTNNNYSPSSGELMFSGRA